MSVLGPVFAGSGQRVTTRRVSAGVHPRPGATSRLTVWWSSRDWVENEVTAAVAEHRDVCRAHHVAPDTVVAVARGMAEHADHRTGRDCRPTNERLVEQLRVSLSTVQRARRVLKELRLVVELVAGRSFMTLAERLAAWGRSSRHRRIAAEFALCSLPRRRPRTKINPQPDLHVVDDDTPPVGGRVRAHLQTENPHLRARTETSEEERAPRAAPTSRSRGTNGPNPAARRLAEGTRARLPWLRRVPVSRLTPPLHRFALADWTPRDIERGIADVLATRGGWRVPRVLRSPAGYLAGLLRELDPADRPGAIDEWQDQVEREERAYRRQLDHGHPCAHGLAGGNVPSPRGVRACPLCRSADPG